MNYSKKNRKAFTLVELIVVIAIVAILAAVSIVSYFAFVNKGNESADIQLVKQLNTFLQGDEALHGTRNTMNEMLDVMLEHGFFVENLTKTASGNDIIWDQHNNRFALVKDEELVYGENSYGSRVKSLTWYFANNVEDVNEKTELGYGIYLTEDFGNSSEMLTVKSSFDVGHNIIENITYLGDLTNGKTVRFRTSSYGTTLNVTAPNDKIYHFDNLGKLVATELDYNCWYEGGNTTFVEVNKGAVVAVEGGVVDKVYATSPQVVVTEDGGDIVSAVCVSTDEFEETPEGYNNFSDSNGGNVPLDYVDEHGDPLTDDGIQDEAEEIISEAQETEVKDKDENYVARVGSIGYYKLQDAVLAAPNGSTVHLLTDVNEAIGTQFGQNIVINLNNHRINAGNIRAGVYQNGIKLGTNGTSVILYNSATITIKNGRILSNIGGASITVFNSNLILDNVEVINESTNYSCYNLIVRNNSTARINNCHLVIAKGNNIANQQCEVEIDGEQTLIEKTYSFGDIIDNQHGHIIVRNGEFRYAGGSNKYCIKSVRSTALSGDPRIDIYGGTFTTTAYNTSSGPVNVYGGTYVEEPVTTGDVVINGNVQNNGDGTWTVIPNA